MGETWLDRAIAWASPQAGLRRMHARVMQDKAKNLLRAYDGADIGRRTEKWNTSHSSQNAENKISLFRLRNRSRDLIRNEPYARRAAQAIVSNTIGEGIIAKAQAKTAGRANKFQSEWLSWSESLDCDHDGTNNFYGLQALVWHTVFESGEVLIRRVKRSSGFGMDIPMQLQILEPDFIDTVRDGQIFDNGNFTIQGVEFDKLGRRVAYWLFPRHPGDIFGIQDIKGLISQRVPAEEIIHLFRTERPGQVRGIPWLAPIMLKLKDLGDYSDFTLMRQKVSACFTSFVTSADAYDLTSGTTPSAIPEKLEPGSSVALPPGTSIEFANPPSSGDFSQFSNAQLRSIASGIGITFETLTNDYSQVNFSSGRMGWIEFQRNIDVWRRHVMIPRFCIPVWRWFTEAATLAGYGSDKVVATWTAPRREMIDPVKETEATKSQVRSGLISLSEAIRQNGYQPDEVLEEIASDNKKTDVLKLTLDTDPRKDPGNQPK